MDFELSDEQLAIARMARDFATAELAPFAAQWDREKHFPLEVLHNAGPLGLGGICVGEDVGGSGLGRVDSVVAIEALATGCPSIAAYISIHNMCAWMIDRFGNRQQRERWLPAMTSMGLLGSYCLTEPGSGSDAAALRTRAVLDGEHYVVSGQKQFISGAGAVGIYVVMVRTGRKGQQVSRHL